MILCACPAMSSLTARMVLHLYQVYTAVWAMVKNFVPQHYLDVISFDSPRSPTYPAGVCELLGPDAGSESLCAPTLGSLAPTGAARSSSTACAAQPRLDCTISGTVAACFIAELPQLPTRNHVVESDPSCHPILRVGFVVMEIVSSATHALWC
eukprot:676975-Rhodomonas_salina.3